MQPTYSCKKCLAPVTMAKSIDFVTSEVEYIPERQCGHDDAPVVLDMGTVVCHGVGGVS